MLICALVAVELNIQPGSAFKEAFGYIGGEDRVFGGQDVENEEFEWRYHLPAITGIALNTTEHSECKWLHIDDAIDAVWSWTNREALTELKKDLR